MVALGNRILLSKDVAGPRATGHLVIEVVSSKSRRSLTQRRAEIDVAEAFEVLERIASDLEQLAGDGLERVYVEDLDTNRVKLASIADDASIDWWPDRGPRA